LKELLSNSTRFGLDLKLANSGGKHSITYVKAEDESSRRWLNGRWTVFV